MSRSSTRRSDVLNPLRVVALAFALASTLTLITTVLLEFVSRRRVGEDVVFVFTACALIGVGTLIIFRRPGNLIGRLCFTAGLLESFGMLAGSYARHAFVSASPSLPAATTMGWFSLSFGGAWVWILLFIPLIFPDGRLPSRRWRPAAWIVPIVLVLDCVRRAFNPKVPKWEPLPYNPLGLGGMEQLLVLLDRIANIGIALVLVAAVSAIVVRFLRSTGIERQQVKWLMYAVAQLIGLFAVYLVVPRAFPQPFSDIIFGISFSLLPVAIAIAVLRYRLYDIDRIINRTIVYATVTVALGVIYAGSVLIAGSLFSDGGRRSEWIVAASTLVAFGAFRPIRARTQEAVDQRFNRTRYDAQRTIAAFNASLREQLDADALSGELLRVTHSAVQPDRCSLWLRTNLR